MNTPTPETATQLPVNDSTTNAVEPIEDVTLTPEMLAEMQQGIHTVVQLLPDGEIVSYPANQAPPISTPLNSTPSTPPMQTQPTPPVQAPAVQAVPVQAPVEPMVTIKGENGLSYEVPLAAYQMIQVTQPVPPQVQPVQHSEPTLEDALAKAQTTAQQPSRLADNLAQAAANSPEVAAYLNKSQQPAQPEPTPQKAQPKYRSPLRSSKNFAAGHIEIEGTTYWYRELDTRLQKWMEARLQWIADKVGITVDELKNGNYASAKPEEAERIPHYLDESYAAVLAGTLPNIEPLLPVGVPGLLSDWNVLDDNGYPAPLTVANVADLAYEIKTQIVAQAKLSTFMGVGPAAFFR